MSSALVRQALELVDPEENTKKKTKRRPNISRHQGQASHPFKKNKKQQKKVISKEEIAEENIKKLLALSAPTADSATAQKIIERAIKGKALSEKIEVNVDNQKSILFPNEPFEEFEKNLLIYKYIPDPQWVLLGCAVWGFFFIGGLMSFTLYHIYPYL